MENYKHIYFIGIGGIGMSGLARLCLHEGKQVSGSDIAKTENTEKLEASGATISYTQDANDITEDVNLVVYTEAISANNAQLQEAQKRGVSTINYFQALGMVANEYYLIAVSGTHGKTTTTAMFIDMLEEASFDPTAIVGALRSKTGSNYRAGKSKYFVVEACEYKRDFLTLQPDVLVITNIEHEHVDYYKDLLDVQSAFSELAQKVSEDGAVIANAHDKNVAPALAGVSAQVVDYKSELDLSLDLHLPGMHNRLNAAAASAAAQFLDIEQKFITAALENFAGTARRFEFKGQCNGAMIYDDYAHHPTEIAASIAGARELYKDRKLTVVFQPHTYSRTQELFNEFVSVLNKADRVILVPIYAAREQNESGVSSEQLSEALAQKGTESTVFRTLDAAALDVQETVDDTDVVIAMGAGDVTKIADILTK